MNFAAPSIADLARRQGVRYGTLRYRLLTMHERDRLEAEAAHRNGHGEPFVGWLYKFPIHRWRVNLSRLRRMHPEFPDVMPTKDLDSNVRRVMKQLELLDAGHRALVRRVANGGTR